MFKTIEINNMICLKNKTAGGAMAETIKNSKENDVVVHIHNKHGRLWANTTPTNLYEQITTTPNFGCFEVICKFPHKAYFDIDCKDTTFRLSAFTDIIYDKIPDALLSISGSEVPLVKNSYHIIVNNYTIITLMKRMILKNLYPHKEPIFILHSTKVIMVVIKI